MGAFENMTPSVEIMPVSIYIYIFS
jgi:hypothetical protein